MNSIRLKTIAELIKNNKVIADIGCDHSYLSIYLLQNNWVDFAYNIDINKEPLNQGRINLINHHINTNRFKMIQNNGLMDLVLDNLNAVSISGMGAGNIISIIKNNPNKIDYYVVQPNNNSYLIRKYLKENNGIILDERLVYENEIYYEVIKFKISENQNTNIINQQQMYFGIYLAQSDLYNDYLAQKYLYLKSIYNDKLSDDLKLQYNLIQQILKKENKDEN